jgi:hypothetical protein
LSNGDVVIELEKEFMIAVATCKNKYGYNPTRFLQMLEEHGPIDTAILLVMAPKIHEGLSKLWEFKRLDLSVEAIICREQYRYLFEEDVLLHAKNRLKELGYSVM